MFVPIAQTASLVLNTVVDAVQELKDGLTKHEPEFLRTLRVKSAHRSLCIVCSNCVCVCIGSGCLKVCTGLGQYQAWKQV